MALSAFDNKSKEPKSSDLKVTLGRTSTHWDSLNSHIAAQYEPLDETWQFAGVRWGWSLRLRHKKRTVLYMTPCKGHFLVGFVLGEKAVKAAHDSALPEAILQAIDAAPKYAEGRGVRVPIKNKNDLEIAKILAAIKMKN